MLELPLCRILPYADLTLEQRFQLDHSGLDSLISMRLVLRVNSVSYFSSTLDIISHSLFRYCLSHSVNPSV